MTMQKSSNTGNGGSRNHLSPKEKIPLWQHHITTGGGDKDRMVTIVNWLLAFSATLIGYIATQIVDFDKRTLKVPTQAATLAVLGIFVSVVALYIVWAYYEHAKWNWKQADALAKEIGILRSGEKPKARETVFGFFTGLACFSFIVHVAVLVWAW